MAMTFPDATRVVGSTPLVRLNHVAEGLEAPFSPNWNFKTLLEA